MDTSQAKITAQIACEYIANEPDAGWDQPARRAVLAQACATGVADFYVDTLAEQIQCVATAAEQVERCDCCGIRRWGHGHFGLYCAECAEQPLTGCAH